MNRQAISVTLSPDSIVWLRARMSATGARSLSEALERVIAGARSAEGARSEGRSAVGLVTIAEDDPDLGAADEEVRALFAAHAARGGASRGRVSRRSRSARRG